MLTRRRIQIVCVLAAAWGVLMLGGCEKRPAVRQASATNRTTTRKPRILVVHSYHPGYQWVASVNRGITMTITPGMVDLETFYMDTKNHPDAEWRKQKACEAIEAIDEWRPDVVITVDDDAQEEIGRELAGRKKPAVVFCGVNKNPEDYGYASGNVTGILERPHFKQSIELLGQLRPQARRIFVLSDAGQMTEGTFASMRQEAAGMPEVEVVDWRMVSTFAEWKQQVRRADSEADALAVYTYHTLLGEADSIQSVPSPQVMEWTVANTSVPIVGFLVFAMDDGSLCGVLESGVEQGAMAARMALKLLQGCSISALPIETGLGGQRMINLKAAKRLQVPVDPLLLEQVDVIVHYEHVE